MAIFWQLGSNYCILCKSLIRISLNFPNSGFEKHGVVEKKVKITRNPINWKKAYKTKSKIFPHPCFPTQKQTYLQSHLLKNKRGIIIFLLFHIHICTEQYIYMYLVFFIGYLNHNLFGQFSYCQVTAFFQFLVIELWLQWTSIYMYF